MSLDLRNLKFTSWQLYFPRIFKTTKLQVDYSREREAELVTQAKQVNQAHKENKVHKDQQVQMAPVVKGDNRENQV